MISEEENKRISKFLSLVLRHKPEVINISLDENGWTDVGTLLVQLEKHGRTVSKEILEHVVDTNAKKRFAFNEDTSRIRANQGHSVEVELNYTAVQPPEILFHGTAAHLLLSIGESGLEKMTRHHVHLSADRDTAVNVGKRHGRPVVLSVAALEMFKDGFKFYLSNNNVWLTDYVPVKYIEKA